MVTSPQRKVKADTLVIIELNAVAVPADAVFLVVKNKQPSDFYVGQV